jgi:nicotinic acid mononucleotide adenylyltransferase
MQSARLDYLYFLPERAPRRKVGVTHYGHRVAMLRRAIRPHGRFGLLDLPTKHFTVLKTLPEIRKHTGKDATLVFLIGSDVAMYLPAWENAEVLARQAELCVGLRETTTQEMVRNILRPLFSTKQLHIVRAFASDVSSSKMRRAIRAEQWAYGLLRSVYGYARQEWLYI